MSETANNINAIKAPKPDTPTPVHLVGRRIFEEEGVWPSYNRIKGWSYDGRFPTIRYGSRAAVAEADWQEAKALILALNKST